MTLNSEKTDRIRAAVQRQRLVDTAVRLIEIPSPTRSAAKVADCLGEMLHEEGFAVERPDAGWPDAPAVVARFDTGRAGRVLQYNGHLDTVHLPFVPPRVEDGILYGSGCSDMKGGIAAAVEAMRVLRETESLPAGGVMLTAHDLHETPWGDGTHVNGLIDAGYVGDGVLLPEYLCDVLPVIGRGQAVLNVTITREGEPVHETLGGIDAPSVIQAGAELIRRFGAVDERLQNGTHHPLAGRASIFVGQVSSGEIYNQAPTELRLAGTRRWLPGSVIDELRGEVEAICGEVGQQFDVRIESSFQVARDGYELDQNNPLVAAFRSAHAANGGSELPVGRKPFVDDGNAFVQQAGVPAITHGPNATGAHTLNEEVPVDELVRVAAVYALTAIEFCESR